MMNRNSLTSRADSDVACRMLSLQQRIKALQSVGLTKIMLAKKARVSAETIGEILSGSKRTRPVTEDAVGRALCEFELPLLDHLIAVHRPNGEGQ